MADGTHRQIRDIRIGDKVLSDAPSGSATVVAVSRSHAPTRELSFRGRGANLRCAEQTLLPVHFHYDLGNRAVHLSVDGEDIIEVAKRRLEALYGASLPEASGVQGRRTGRYPSFGEAVMAAAACMFGMKRTERSVIQLKSRLSVPPIVRTT